MSQDKLKPVVRAIQAPPMLAPTEMESAALAAALANVEIAPAPERTAPSGLGGFVLASVVAFALIATLLALHTFGVMDLISAVTALGPLTIGLTLIVIVFVTSFVPIAVTARRRPLNGMTFRR